MNKFIEFNNLCEKYDFPKPSCSFLIDETFNQEQAKKLLHYKKDLNLAIKVERKIDTTQNVKGSLRNSVIKDENKEKEIREFFNDFYSGNIKKSLNPNYLITLKDGSQKAVGNVTFMVSTLDEGGFIAKNCYCNSAVNNLFIKPNGDYIYNFCHTFQRKRKNLFKDSLILDTS
jgi:hypothetical protein